MKMVLTAAILVMAALVVLVIGCPGGAPTAPTRTMSERGITEAGPPSAPPVPPPGPAPVRFTPRGETVSLLAVGDIGMCSARQWVERTADLVARMSGEVLLLGDLAYMHGTLQNFRDCFDPAWGRFRSRWRPVPGNHEYETANAAGYHAYFGTAGSAGGRSYYSFRTGDWLVLMLDSNLPAQIGSAQYDFVREALAATPAPCAVAAWHHPLFSSGPNGPNVFMRDLWRLLYDNGADVVLAAHDHLYERFGKQDVDAHPDPRGLRQFIVGTGGAHLYDFPRRERHSEAQVRAHGVLHLTLQPDGYRWEFVETTGAVRDAGAERCH